METAVLLLLLASVPGSQISSVDHRRGQTAPGRVRREPANYLFTLQECGHFPCFETASDPEQCEHAVGIPDNLTAQAGFSSQCGDLQAVILRWNPSRFGIVFLQGYQIRVRSIDSSNTYSECRQLAVKPETTISSEVVFAMIFCVPPGSQYLFAVNVYPIPRGQEREAKIIMYQTERAAELPTILNSDWVPENISFQQDWSGVTVRFNTAPDTYGFQAYHLNYGQIPRGKARPDSWEEKSVPHDGERAVTLSLGDLQPGYNYSVMIYSDFLNARRRILTHYVSADNVATFPVTWIIISGVTIFAVGVVTAGIFIAIRARKRTEGIQDLNPGAGDGDKQLLRPPPDRPRPVPTVFLCHCDRDDEKLVNVTLQFAAYLQEHCGCQVVLDRWEQLAISCEGHVDWLSRQLEECDYVIVVCSRGLKAWVESRRRGPQTRSQAADHLGQGASFIVTVSMIGQKICQAVMSSPRDLCKFIVTFFTHSGQGDIPGVLDLASKYHLMRDFPLLFSHLHSMELCRPGHTLHVDNISQDTYWRTPSGLALYNAIAGLHSDETLSVSGVTATDTVTAAPSL